MLLHGSFKLLASLAEESTSLYSRSFTMTRKRGPRDAEGAVDRAVCQRYNPDEG